MRPVVLMTRFAAFSLFISCNSPGIVPKDNSEKKIIENQGVRIDYTDTGKGDTTLFFVHGWSINKTYWIQQEDFFKNRYRIITIDLPGFGQSGKNRSIWTTENYGQDIDTVMAALNLKNVVLIGHSMSGEIIAEAAAREPERVIALVGIDNFKNFGHPITKEDEQAYTRAMAEMKKNFTSMAREYFSQELFYKTTDSAVRKRILTDLGSVDTSIAIATIEYHGYDVTPRLLAAKKKLYLINSDVTPTDTAGFVAQHIPYQLFEIHETGHYPMIEKPVEFNQLLDQVMRSISGEKR